MRRAAASLVCSDASLLVASRRCSLATTRYRCPALPTELFSLSLSWIRCPAAVKWFGARGTSSHAPCSPLYSSVEGKDEEGAESDSSLDENSSDESQGLKPLLDDVFENGEKEVEMGDGEDGGGIVLGGAPWAARALEIARRMLTPGMALYGFKACSTGFIQIRLDKLTNKFGSPTIEEVEKFNVEYGLLIEEAGRTGVLPPNVAIEVSSPGAERVVQVPVELDRFKDLPMQVCYYADGSTEQQQILELESFDKESLTSVWKLANVRVNREARGKGRVLNRKQREWRLELSITSIKLVRLHVDAFCGGDDEE